jgi:heme oxygenase (biliverdin-IX-beta and delta-forming)
MPADDRECALGLLRRGRAALATVAADGSPFASIVLVARDKDGAPLLLLSDLAEHTRNLRRDPRIALLFDGTEGMAEPLAGPRLTVTGRLAPAPEKVALDRYVARHPAAVQWTGMADFRLYRMKPDRAPLVAGFGRIASFEAPELFFTAELGRPHP